jgi:NAD(P)-dependent dehydrogenase (short-subunit alcohol dehydrogenase family)
MTHRSPRFAHRTAVVTGGGTGIGQAVALAFAREGANVVVAGRTAARLAETVNLVEIEGGKAAAVVTDITQPEDVVELVQQTTEHFGSLDIAINNAGILRGIGPVGDVSDQDWQILLDTNMTGVLRTMRQEIAQMRTQIQGGTIVNISSNLGAHLRLPNLGAYLATKAAVSALTRAAALDHIHESIRINSVSPGASATTMSLRPGETEAERATRMKDETPVGRVSTLEEIAAAVLYVASPEAASVVGTDLVVDGGASA